MSAIIACQTNVLQLLSHVTGNFSLGTKSRGKTKVLQSVKVLICLESG